MKNKPIIAIVARKIKHNNKDYIGCYQNYLKKVIINGGIPIIVYLDNIENIIKIVDMCNGVIITGGDDLDNIDVQLNNHLLNNDIPTLGICLGMQIMMVSEGSNLISAKNHMNKMHDILLIKNTLINKIYKNSVIEVNSRHYFKVGKSNNYIVSAVSFDGVIEAIERKDKKFFIGVQWHPEDLSDNLLFKKFIKACKE